EAGPRGGGRTAVVGELEAAVYGGDAVNADGRRGRAVRVAVVIERAAAHANGWRGRVDGQAAGNGRVGVRRVGAGERRHDGVGAGGRRRRGVAVVGEGEVAGHRRDVIGTDRGGGGRVRGAVIGERSAAHGHRRVEGQNLVEERVVGCADAVGRG